MKQDIIMLKKPACRGPQSDRQHRMSFIMNNDDLKRIERLSKMTDSSTMTHVVRDALILMEYMMLAQEKESKIMIQDPGEELPTAIRLYDNMAA